MPGPNLTSTSGAADSTTPTGKVPAKVEEFPDTTFIIGTGVCPASWAPVCRALHQHLSRLGLASPPEVSSGLANFIFAHHVHMKRLWARESSNADRSDDFRKLAGGYDEVDKELRRTIAQELDQAQSSGSIQLEERFLRALELPWTGKKLVFTANWDTLVERRGLTQPRSLFHLHGDITRPETLLLPTEVVDDPSRTQDVWMQQKEILGSLWRLAGAAHNVWLYGISLSPLDIEIGMLLHIGLSEQPRRSPRRIIVSSRSEDLPAIEQRVRLVARMGQQPFRLDLDPVQQPLTQLASE